MWAEVLAGLDEDDTEEEGEKMDEDEEDLFLSPDFLPTPRKTDCHPPRPKHFQSETFSSRSSSTALHFYQNRQLELLTLRQLVFFGRSITEERLIKSANYVRTELPTLPYVVVNQEGVANVYEAYWSAFDKFRRYPEIKTIQENDAFCRFVRGLLDEHKAVIPNLSLGLSLSSPYLEPDRLDSFMHRMLVSRISRRVLAEHHIALSRYFSTRQDGKRIPENRVGVIHLRLPVKDSIEKCARFLRKRAYDAEQDQIEGTSADAPWPEVVIEGHLDIKFSYIPAHLEYVVFELLKNSLRATRLKHTSLHHLPPIRATVVAGENEVTIRISDQDQYPMDLFSFSHLRNPARMDNRRLGALRTISSSQTGMVATVEEQVKRWETEADSEDPHRKLGYFGGSLELVSLDGYGTDAYLRLPKLGTNLEGIELW
ncbi:alpha-ketoacid dehydrogenase kinase N-terminal domain-containing protein [Fomitopsis serialis]|uniref:alpha-ketoacid dehydrogenase kinase N-terminal domain-containing protein n=1 Tax=Fomitopsis serialis TaxID=139415 RepID=UPI002008E417|nr:alpha-ketoacid dehydrogenase kinase N-terminal domain-containing protein [Neoantrodia serialis]KAH9938135.1 alpha-ketoacid dehydrogenase kinase N-terminal domain-containing protein [Neoantrodia serialis]